VLSWQVRDARAREAAAREAAAREAQARRSTAVDDGEAIVSLSDDGSASLTLPPVSTAASSPLDGDPTPDDLTHEQGGPIDDSADTTNTADLDHTANTAELGDELDAELEAEAAGMAPLVELPDRAAFGHESRHASEPAVTFRPSESGDLLTVRVRGQGRVPARKVRRVIRRVDPLSVLKLSFAFSLCLFAMFLVAAVLLWSAAIGSGSTDNIESFLIDIGFEDFRLVGADLFRGFVVFGGSLVIAGTVFAVLLALLFNLISDIVGGIRFTVIEPVLPAAEPVEPPESAEA